MNPEYAAGTFYDKLLTVADWQTLPLTVAAQALQVIADANAYATHEPDATALVAIVASQGSWAIPSDLEQCVSTSGWTDPLPVYKVTSGFRTAERPSHDGVDIPAPRGAPIHAAASGVVIKVACNANLNGQPYSCDVDGSPTVAGCGWFAEVLTGNIIHRYCHQLIKSNIVVGQQVTAGQIIGLVGSSGHSSGPHLHFEIHDVTNSGGRSATSENALNPETFLRSMGVPMSTL